MYPTLYAPPPVHPSVHSNARAQPSPSPDASHARARHRLDRPLRARDAERRVRSSRLAHRARARAATSRRARRDDGRCPGRGVASSRVIPRSWRRWRRDARCGEDVRSVRRSRARPRDRDRRRRRRRRTVPRMSARSDRTRRARETPREDWRTRRAGTRARASAGVEAMGDEGWRGGSRTCCSRWS